MRDDKSIRGATAKRETRELRRAMGVEALKVISDHEDAIAALAASLHSLRVEVVAMKGAREAVSDNHAQQLVLLGRRIDIVEDDQSSLRYELRSMPLLRRLRWLFQGR